MITYLNPDDSKWISNIQFGLFSALIEQSTSLVAVFYVATVFWLTHTQLDTKYGVI